jgi:N-acetylglucosaminyl-diphospho-decaprenol L-rhamnosyltransferase
MVRIDVVTVTYNSAETVTRALEPLTGQPSIRIVAVDNASADSTLAVLSDLPVDTIPLAENRGFAHGCNVGSQVGKAPFVLFLNPDAVIDPGAVQLLADELEADERAGAAAPRILEGDGSLDFSLRRFPRLRSTFAQALFLHRVFPDATWVDEVVRDRSDYERASVIDWVSGACILVRRSVLEELGGLDESFFHYSEDVDLCARIWESGYQVRYVPTAVAHHDGGVSAPRTRLLPVLAASRIRYSAKHDRPPTVLLVRAGVVLGALTHTLVARGGRQARCGHLRALGVALRPLPNDAGCLVREH